ncbi:RNA polymerase 2 general transcription and DNA repair factor tfiih component [Xylaria bambusicola]|uniref:RNA polymerase 2 general transcription and DNA repair factor tfiih component n=1 Tax=Xylaria bambusicola TaxID=326684 RepID=UPI002007C145|nr:RNA polymerase 2 general transcription and DNA repair factor tfiih component [Xylaria bambusicola]KAI0522027.1 RNA polymerase 2 general transcription and DNA repair factor tfiih component [Xylaria bambusicola]
MVRAIKGTLVECDPSIKSIIINIDSDKNDYIIEDLDDSHLLIKDVMLAQLKSKLEDRLKETVPIIDNDDSGSDRDVKK